jgi:hypothetical protein
MDAFVERRSRRFGRGFQLDGGPLTYTSRKEPQALTIEQEAALAFAACGITGYALAELPYNAGGNIMAQFIGRTVASGDALHTVAMFVANDQGTWMLKRPQDFPRAELPQLVAAARNGELVSLYERCRIRISDRRAEVPRKVPFVPTFNHWMANMPGSTYFIPVNELTALYINILLTAFSPEFGYYVLDDRAGFQAPGIARFAKSRGGFLNDDPRLGRVATIDVLETWLCEFTTIEQGGMLQNLALMAQALGLGGFPHFAAHPYAWAEALGFRMETIPLSRTIGAGPVKTRIIKALGKDLPVPTPVGLSRDGTALLKPCCPPYYPTMRDAVLAFVDSKYAAGTGWMRDGGIATGWNDGAQVQSAIPKYPDATIEAAIAYAEYVYGRYGRFPAKSGPFRTVTNFQAHVLDPEFYDRFYKPDALSATQRALDATLGK